MGGQLPVFLFECSADLTRAVLVFVTKRKNNVNQAPREGGAAGAPQRGP